MNRRVFESTITDFQAFILEQTEVFLDQRKLNFDRTAFETDANTDLRYLGREVLFAAGVFPEEALAAA